VFELLGVVDALGYPHPIVLKGYYEVGYEDYITAIL